MVFFLFQDRTYNIYTRRKASNDHGEKIMKIDKVMNNNVVSSIDEDGQEIIVVGTGIGFQGKEGKVVDEKKIQKIFRLEDPKMIRKLKEILQDLPMEQFEISTAIIEHAKQSLGTELNENIYVTLTDHIHFAIQRYEDHMNFPNPMLREVRLFYEKEFALGEYALGMIKQRLNISLPLDDAASIALHIVSAEFDTRVKDTLKITEFLEDVMEQIKNYFHLEIDTQSLSYERFITHFNDDNKIDEAKIKSSGAAGIIRPGKGNIQVIIGPKVQFVADEMEKLCK